jgi:hypothetical protein
MGRTSPVCLHGLPQVGQEEIDVRITPPPSTMASGKKSRYFTRLVKYFETLSIIQGQRYLQQAASKTRRINLLTVSARHFKQLVIGWVCFTCLMFNRGSRRGFPNSRVAQ